MKRAPASLDLGWLIRLRWISAAAQIALIALLQFGFAMQLPLTQLGVVILVLLLTNAALVLSSKRRPDRAPSEVGVVLILDTVLLYFLLLLTGGPSNPFSILFLVHIALAAVLLGAAWTWLLAAVASTCFAGLFFWHLPMPHMPHANGDSFSVHLYGMLLAFVVTAFLIAYFVSRVAALLQQKELRLRDLERQRQNQLRLSSLATLAAGAAHELATPLSTIAVAAGELAEEIADQPLVAEDVQLIRDQVQRCRLVLDQMSVSGGQSRVAAVSSVSPATAIAAVLRKLSPVERELVHCEIDASGELAVPEVGLRQCVGALLRNALEAGGPGDKIYLQAYEDVEGITIEIRDTGCGMAAEVRERVGEPFFSTKEPGAGMGLGLFLTKAFVDQYAGRFEVDSSPHSGTAVRLWLPKCRAVVGG